MVRPQNTIGEGVKDAHVYGLIFVKSNFEGTGGRLVGGVGFFFHLRVFQPQKTIGEALKDAHVYGLNFVKYILEGYWW